MSTGNTKYGQYALNINATPNSFSSAFGLQALEESVYINNTAVGAFSGANTNIGQNNVSMGTNSLLTNTSGSYNTAIGTAAMCFSETGTNNTAIGCNALENGTASNNNTAIGSEAGLTDTGSNNTFIGTLADSSVAGINNSTAIGYNSKATASNQIRMGTSTEQVSIPGSLSVVGASTLSSLSASSTLSVTGASTLSSTLTVSGAATLSSTLTTAGTATFNGAANFNGATSIGGTFTVNTSGNSASFNDSVQNTYAMRAKDNTSGYYIAFYPYAGQGSLNNCVTAGDCMIAAIGTQSTNTLTLTTWSSGSSAGINIKPYYVQMRGQTNLDYQTYHNTTNGNNTYTVPINFYPWLFLKSDYGVTITIKLPEPSSSYIGALLNIRRQPTVNFQMTLQTVSGAAVMVQDNTPTPSATIPYPNTVYYAQLTCDGTYWYVVVKNQV